MQREEVNGWSQGREGGEPVFSAIAAAENKVLGHHGYTTTYMY